MTLGFPLVFHCSFPAELSTPTVLQTGESAQFIAHLSFHSPSSMNILSLSLRSSRLALVRAFPSPRSLMSDTGARNASERGHFVPLNPKSASLFAVAYAFAVTWYLSSGIDRPISLILSPEITATPDAVRIIVTKMKEQFVRRNARKEAEG